MLAATLGVRDLDLAHRIDAAARAGVVREVGDGRRAAFTHAVVRRTLQDHVGPDRAAELHRRIGDALVARDEAGQAVPAAEIAHHYLRAGDAGTVDQAVRWGRAAADQARLETAFEGAVWFLGRVVEVHDAHGGAPADLACELRLDLADAHDRAGEFLARDRRHLEAAALARALGRTDLLTRAALGFGGRLPAAPPSNPQARELLAEVLDRLPGATAGPGPSSPPGWRTSGTGTHPTPSARRWPTRPRPWPGASTPRWSWPRCCARGCWPSTAPTTWTSTSTSAPR